MGRDDRQEILFIFWQGFTNIRKRNEEEMQKSARMQIIFIALTFLHHHLHQHTRWFKAKIYQHLCILAVINPFLKTPD